MEGADLEHGRHGADTTASPFKSGPIARTVTVLMTVLVVAVLVAMVGLLVLTVVLQPHSPYVAVQAAQLETLRSDGLAFNDLQMSLGVAAHNNNPHSTATFSRLQCRLKFAGEILAVLRADPFSVPTRANVTLPYLASVRDAPLGDAGNAQLQAALRDGVIPFEVECEARTRYKFTRLSINQWTRISCQIRFFVPNGTALEFNCAPKEPPYF